MAVPAFFAVTSPLLSTSAMVFSPLMLHETAAFLGAFVFNCLLSEDAPAYNRIFSSLIEIPCCTLTLHSAVTPLAVAEITASPSLFPVTLPPFTVATFGLELCHVIFFDAPIIVGSNLIELPAPLVLNCISFTLKEIALSNTVTLQEAVLPFAAAVMVAVRVLLPSNAVHVTFP